MGGVFATKETGENIASEHEIKDQAAASYILNNIIENLPPFDPDSSKLTDEEKQETLDEFYTSVNTLEGDLPELINPFVDNNSNNRKPLEPKQDDVQ